MIFERYCLFNKDEDFPAAMLRGLVYSRGVLSPVSESPRGWFVSGVMDSAENGCRWKRVRADCDIPEGAGISFTFYTADTQADAVEMRKLLENVDIPAGVGREDLKKYERLSVQNGRDFLIGAAKGRYLAFIMEMSVQAGFRPELRSVQLWSAAETFTRYLPEIYREEDSFLERYLQIFASQYFETERQATWIKALLDPLTAREEQLRWLAGFLNIDHVDLWDTTALRLLLTEGVYRLKGTLGGLTRLIEIYTGEKPLVAESFRMKTGAYENDALYAEKTLIILLPGRAARHMNAPEPLRMIIEAFLPAGVTYSLMPMTNSTVLSGYTYLNVNSVLSSYAQATLGEPYGLEYVVLGE